MPKISRATVVSAAVLAASMMAAGVAPAAPANRHPGVSVFYLTISPASPPGVEPVRTRNAQRAALLMCDPPGGSHDNAQQACRQLHAVDGRIERMQPANEPCTLELAPVNVKAVGLWHNRYRTYDAEYGNLCQALDATGAVFTF